MAKSIIEAFFSHPVPKMPFALRKAPMNVGKSLPVIIGHANESKFQNHENVIYVCYLYLVPESPGAIFATVENLIKSAENLKARSAQIDDDVPISHQSYLSL